MTNGKHIKVQMYGVTFGKLKSEQLADRFLVEVVAAVGMRALDDPWVYDIKETLESQGEKPDEKEPEGVTGVVVLSTSHAAIHTWPHRAYAAIDVFSCVDFDTPIVTGVVERIYEPLRVDVKDLSYSLEIPDLPVLPGKS